MAIKLERRTNQHQLLKLVSVIDEAIDWDKTYGEETSMQRKKNRYMKEHILSDLVYKEGCEPTLFVFEHPARVDVSRKIRHLYTRQIAGRDAMDVFTEVWDKTFQGTEEGLDGKREPPARRDDHITDSYFQSLEDAGVLEELAGAVLDVAGQNNKAEREVLRKK